MEDVFDLNPSYELEHVGFTNFPQPPLQAIGINPFHVRLFGCNAATFISCVWRIAWSSYLQDEMDEDFFFPMDKQDVKKLTGLGISEQVGIATTLQNLKILDIHQDNGDVVVLRLNTKVIEKMVKSYRFGV